MIVGDRVADGAFGNYAENMRPSLVRDHGQPRGLEMPLDVCTREIECGAAELFGMDPEVVSVGIIRMPGGYGFGVRRYRENSVTPLRRGDLRAMIGRASCRAQ